MSQIDLIFFQIENCLWYDLEFPANQLDKGYRKLFKDVGFKVVKEFETVRLVDDEKHTALTELLYQEIYSNMDSDIFQFIIENRYMNDEGAKDDIKTSFKYNKTIIEIIDDFLVAWRLTPEEEKMIRQSAIDSYPQYHYL